MIEYSLGTNTMNHPSISKNNDFNIYTNLHRKVIIAKNGGRGLWGGTFSDFKNRYTGFNSK